MRIILRLSYPQSGKNTLHIVIALKTFTLVSNKKSILVVMFDFAVTQVDNFCEIELFTVMFKHFDGKYAGLVLFKPKRHSDMSVQMLTCILATMTEQIVFAFVIPTSNLGLDSGIGETLLASSKALRNSPELSSRDSFSSLEMLISSLRRNRCCNFESQKRNTLNEKDFLLDPLLTRTLRWWDCEMSRML